MFERLTCDEMQPFNPFNPFKPFKPFIGKPYNWCKVWGEISVNEIRSVDLFLINLCNLYFLISSNGLPIKRL